MKAVYAAIFVMAFVAFVVLTMPTDYAAQQRAYEQAEALATLDLALAAGWRVLPFLLALAFGALAVLYFAVRLRLVRVDGTPVHVTQLRDVAPAVVQGNTVARIAQAQHAPVPMTYSPHVTYQNKSEGVLAPEAEAAPLALPGVTDLATINHTPSAQSILLGLGAGGSLVTVPASALCHVALCGATGMGKSNLMRLLLPQILAMGAEAVLADPHYTDYDAEGEDDWRAIRRRLKTAPARNPADIGKLLLYLTHELDRRLELRTRGEHVGKPLFLALDELPVIVENVKHAPQHLAKILREGRKVRLYVVGASQDFLVKTLGGTSAVRDCYRTAFYVGGDLTSARTLLDMPQREINEGALQPGVAYLRSSATPHAELVRVPLASNRAIERLLGATNIADVAEPRNASATAKVDIAPSLEKTDLIRRMRAQGIGKVKIIEVLWDVRPGGGSVAYQKASAEYDKFVGGIE